MSDDTPTEREYLRLILEMAGSFQGGHSATGDKIAELLNIPFPLTMKNLATAARKRGFDPDSIWPWYAKMLADRAALEAASREASDE